MKTRGEKIDLLTHVTHYHENVGAHLKHAFATITQDIATNEKVKARERFALVYEQNFTQHFRFEEEVVFPALLIWQKAREYDSLVEEYIQMHHHLLNIGMEITLLLCGEDEVPLDKEGAEQLVVLLARLHVGAMKHIEDENCRVVPLVTNDPTLRFLTARNMVGLTARLRNQPR